MVNIKKHRGEKQVTQRELASIIGVSRNTLITAENNPKYCLAESKALKLAEFFGCSVYDLVDVKGRLPYNVTEKDIAAIEKQLRG
jgi:DNA-binding XRE family transcriptional regulator